MAARKRTVKAKRKTAPARKARKTAAASAKRPAKKANKPAKKTAKKSVKAATKRAPASKAKSKTARKTKGEGDYAASRAFLKDQSGFVEKNKGRIPAMGKAAEAALDGPDGAALRDAEATAAARSRDIF